MRIHPTLSSYVLALVLGLGLWSCDSTEVDHYAAALAIERELLRQNPEADYGDHRYLAVMRELDKVPLGAATRKKADKLWQRISDGRRFALTEKLPQHAGDLPDRLAGTEAPAPPRVRRASAPKNRAASNTPNPPATRAPKANRPAVAATPADPEALARLDITLYSTPWCGYCSKARSWLQSKGYPFVEKNIEKDPAAHKEYLVAGKGYRGVPLILVNGKSFRGFNKRSVKRAIDKVLAGS